MATTGRVTRLAVLIISASGERNVDRTCSKEVCCCKKGPCTKILQGYFHHKNTDECCVSSTIAKFTSGCGFNMAYSRSNEPSKCNQPEKCSGGFRGFLVWESTGWTDKDCQRVSCPAHSDAGNDPVTCKCTSGYSGQLAWDSAAQERKGFCQRVLCPVHSDEEGTDPVTCTCTSGYAGHVAWDPDAQQWRDFCSECPFNKFRVGGAPQCPCPRGFRGSLVFESGKRRHGGSRKQHHGEWTYGNCEPVSCPRDSDAVFANTAQQVHVHNQEQSATSKNQHQQPTAALDNGPLMCRCASGYFGDDVTWDWASQQWTGACISSMCPEGFSGKVLSAQSNTCKWEPCPPWPADAGEPQQCRCQDGFVGKVKWDYEEQKWTHNCRLKNCPRDSDATSDVSKQNPARCTCRAPKKCGEVIWDVAGSEWISFCEPCNG
mmetsp:Transcript_123170/g.239452  ORF Transcript_123170/g.239452 Transcript_123170/m.239452 type:complete len:431 (+) Transcript_123170:38-1330(+)